MRGGDRRATPGRRYQGYLPDTKPLILTVLPWQDQDMHPHIHSISNNARTCDDSAAHPASGEDEGTAERGRGQQKERQALHPPVGVECGVDKSSFELSYLCASV